MQENSVARRSLNITVQRTDRLVPSRDELGATAEDKLTLRPGALTILSRVEDAQDDDV